MHTGGVSIAVFVPRLDLVRIRSQEGHWVH